MKIEKVNEHQIRCTLTKDDLAKRELKISELTYGSEKAKNLFRDMMQQASFEFGFEAENIPLMIEAIPMNAECIVLIITKVEDPEELDTRFSKFAPSIQGNSEDIGDIINEITESGEEVLDLFRKIQEKKGPVNEPSTPSENKKKEIKGEVITEEQPDLSVIYSFNNLNGLISVAKFATSCYNGINSLYKNEKNARYILVITNNDSSKSSFNKICNMLSEYGNTEHFASAGDAFLEEHFTPIIKENALQALATL